jgi:hypothetical protein
MSLPDFVSRPVVDEDWWAGYLGPVQVLYYGPRVTQQGFDRYLGYLTQELDALTPGQRQPIFYECPSPTLMPNEHRQRVAKVLADRRERMRRGVAGYVMVTESLLVRSMVQTVFFFARPPYPTAVEAKPLAGFRALQKYVPELNADAVCGQYVAAKAVFAKRAATVSAA